MLCWLDPELREEVDKLDQQLRGKEAEKLDPELREEFKRVPIGEIVNDFLKEVRKISVIFNCKSRPFFGLLFFSFG